MRRLWQGTGLSNPGSGVQFSPGAPFTSTHGHVRRAAKAADWRSARVGSSTLITGSSPVVPSITFPV